MRWRPVLLGAAMVTAGAAVVAVSVAVAVHAGTSRLPTLPTWLGLAALGGLLAILGIGLLRDVRRSAVGPRRDRRPATLPFPHPSPQQDIGWARMDSSTDGGGGAGGGGGGDCGGSGGGS